MSQCYFYKLWLLNVDVAPTEFPAGCDKERRGVWKPVLLVTMHTKV